MRDLKWLESSLNQLYGYLYISIIWFNGMYLVYSENILPSQLNSEIELSSCGYNRPLEVHQTLSPLQYWVIPIHKALYTIVAIISNYI